MSITSCLNQSRKTGCSPTSPRRSAMRGKAFAWLAGLLCFGALGAPVLQGAEPKLIVAMAGFPCGFNDFAGEMCRGFADGAKELGDGFVLDVKTGIDYSDQTAYNNLIETTLQINPAGIIVFPGGPAAQVPVLRRACEQGIKVMIIDNPVEGLGECQSAYVAADHVGLGSALGEWLLANPPRSKEVGIVTLPPGQYASNDARIEGFKSVVEAAGYTVVATVVTDLSLDKTRTLVTNMVAAHPKIGSIIAMNGNMGDSAALGVTDPEITMLSIDGSSPSLDRLVKGERRADALQDPYSMGRLAVVNMGRLLEGEAVPASIMTEARVLDATNVTDYLEEFAAIPR